MRAGQDVRPLRKCTRTGCLACLRAKVRCSEERPCCARCGRLKLDCFWQPPHANRVQWQLQAYNTPDAVYVRHFIDFYSRFLACSNDGESNPFAQRLVPLAVESPGLYYSMAALAAAHLGRRRGEAAHTAAATTSYTKAIVALNTALDDVEEARSDATLEACLLLCVYEICYSGESLWLRDLKGARELIVHRQGLSTDHFLLRFFSLLDVSGSLLASQETLLPGNYWLGEQESSQMSHPWPYYDGGLMVDNSHALMVYMARVSRLSSKCLAARQGGVWSKRQQHAFALTWGGGGASPLTRCVVSLTPSAAIRVFPRKRNYRARVLAACAASCTGY